MIQYGVKVDIVYCECPVCKGDQQNRLGTNGKVDLHSLTSYICLFCKGNGLTPSIKVK